MDISGNGDIFETETAARLYLAQGHPNEALRIFEKLLAKKPENKRLREEVQKLKDKISLESSPAFSVDEKIEYLKKLLERIKESKRRNS